MSAFKDAGRESIRRTIRFERSIEGPAPFPAIADGGRETVRTGIVVRTQIHRGRDSGVEIGEFRGVGKCLIGGKEQIIEPLIAQRELLLQSLTDCGSGLRGAYRVSCYPHSCEPCPHHCGARTVGQALGSSWLRGGAMRTTCGTASGSA